MKKLLIVISVAFVSSTLLKGQNNIDSSLYVITCDPFNPEDTLGQVIWELVNNYEQFGHFGKFEIGAVDKGYIANFEQLFAPNTMIPNDLEGLDQLINNLSIEEYTQKAGAKGYQPYTLVTERGLFTARRTNTEENYIGYVRIFKAFNDTARLGIEYDQGVMYELEISLNNDSLNATISNITLLNKEVYQKFMFSAFGYQGNSKMLVSNNLDKLLIYKEPPKPKVPRWSKSGFFLHGGYLFTDYLSSERFRNNENANAGFTGNEYGYVAGLQYQKVYGDNGFFGILFGVEYEMNVYDFSHSALLMNYFTDCDGNQLIDLEEGAYDRREVRVSNYQESGEITYIRPEIGLFVNLEFSRSSNLHVFGAIGNAFVSNNTYNASATVSYSGFQDGINTPVEDRPELGFYRDLEQEFSREHQTLQGFMFYRFGASLDFRLSNWLAFSLLAEYRGSMTYALRFREFNCAFLDPDDERTFVSQLDYLSTSRNYSAIGVQAGFKIFIKEKKRQQSAVDVK